MNIEDLLNFFMVDVSSSIFDPDTLSISVLTVSVIGFLILFSVASYLGTREDHLLSDNKKNQDSLGSLCDPRLRFLTTLEDPAVIIKLLISSLMYLIALLVCLINYFFQSYKVLYIDLFITIIATATLCYVFCKILWRAKVVTNKDVRVYMEERQWLEGKDNS